MIGFGATRKNGFAMCNRTVGFCHGCGRPDSELVGATALCCRCYISLCEQAATATAEWYREAEWSKLPELPEHAEYTSQANRTWVREELRKPEQWAEADANPEG